MKPLRVLMLHFIDGMTPLGGRQSIAAPGFGSGGVPSCKAIQRIPGGYLVEATDGKLFVVHDAQVRAAQVEFADEKAELVPAQPPPVAPKTAPEGPSEAELAAQAAKDALIKRRAEERAAGGGEGTGEHEQAAGGEPATMVRRGRGRPRASETTP